MSATNDGGPAFPLQAHGDEAKSRYYLTQQGMTLRDYFAAAALQGFCANQHWNPTQSVHFANLAEDAFIAADAMLKERKDKP